MSQTRLVGGPVVSFSPGAAGNASFDRLSRCLPKVFTLTADKGQPDRFSRPPRAGEGAGCAFRITAINVSEIPAGRGGVARPLEALYAKATRPVQPAAGGWPRRGERVQDCLGEYVRKPGGPTGLNLPFEAARAVKPAVITSK